MPKPIIAIDIDDVLAGENETMREFINKTFRLNLTPEDYLVEAPYHGYWEKVWDVDEKEGRKRYQAYLDSGIKEHHSPLEGAVKAITKLQEKYDLVIVTSRYDFLIDITHRWLEEHFRDVFKSVEFVPVWDKSMKISKAKICKKVGASYLIDDNVEHCSLANEEGIKSLLFGEYGWNRAKKLPPGVTLVKNWQEVLEYFDAKG